MMRIGSAKFLVPGAWCVVLGACCVVLGVRGANVFRRPLERVASMDPLRSSAVYDSQACSLVYEPPLQVDYFARPYKLRPGLCALPEVSSDGLVYTFRILPGSEFHADPCLPGGKARPVTSADLVYSLNRLRDPKNASSGMWTMEAVKSVEAVDPMTVRITLKKRLHIFPWLMAMSYSGVVAHEAVEKYGIRFGGVAVGSGAFRLAEWWRNHRMRFVRVPEWRGWKEIKSQPYDEVEYLVVDDASTQWLMFLGKEVDLLRGVANENWDAVVGPDGKLAGDLEQRGVRLHNFVTMEVGYFGVNMKDPVLGPNKKLRQALNCAFDFPAYRRFEKNRLLQATGPVPPGIEGRLETPFAYAFNVEKAKQLLVEAGYKDGIDPKTGKRLVIEASLGRANQTAREEIELMQSFYDRVGIKLEARYMTWDAYLKAINEGKAQLFMLAWSGDYPDAENFLMLFHTKNFSPGSNHGCYSNPAFDREYDLAMEASSAEERNRHWRAAQEIIREDCPWIFLSHPMRTSITWNHLGNYKPSDFLYGNEKYFYPDKEVKK